ncbi:MAG: DUF1311 domain-containing protein [Rhizobiaceae bacterium]|nr:DUF1311 domain-containing protein [Rhizobiaceae bacterium]
MTRALLLAVLLLPSGAVLAQGLDCDTAQTQSEMNICAAEDYRQADAGLNAVWKRAREAAKALDDAQPEESLKGADKALLAAQRGWIAYRDGQCELAGFEARGGSMEPMLVSGCLAAQTRARTSELRAFIGGPEG